MASRPRMSHRLSGSQAAQQEKFQNHLSLDSNKWGRTDWASSSSNTGGVIGLPRSYSVDQVQHYQPHHHRHHQHHHHPQHREDEDDTPLGRVAFPNSDEPQPIRFDSTTRSLGVNSRTDSHPNLHRLGSNGSIHILSSHGIEEETPISPRHHRRHTMIDLSEPSKLNPLPKERRESEALKAKLHDERMIIAAWGRGEDSIQAHSSQDMTRQRSASPRILDLEQLSERHRQSLVRLQSSVNIVFEEEAMKKQFEERRQAEAREMAKRESRRQSTLSPVSSEAKPKKLSSKPRPRNSDDKGKGFFSSLFSCFHGKAGHDRTDASKVKDDSSHDLASTFDEKITGLESPVSRSRLLLDRTSSATGSLEKVAEWNASIARGSTPPVRPSSALKPTATAADSVQKGSKHSWLEY